MTASVQPTSAAPASRVDGLLDRFYPMGPNGERHCDGTAPFYDWLRSSVDLPRACVLNVGAGPTPEVRRQLRSEVRWLAGVDVDPLVLGNVDLDEASVIDGTHLPYADASFDAAYSDWTMEHVQHPAPLLREIHRTLKPGASYWFRTTNLHHYVTALSSRTPHRVHRTLLRMTGSLPGGRDPWPTYYRSNTSATVRALLAEAGFATCDIRMVESYPTYLTFSRLAFLAGVAYERLVNSTDRLSGLRLVLLARAGKPDRDPAAEGSSGMPANEHQRGTWP